MNRAHALVKHKLDFNYKSIQDFAMKRNAYNTELMYTQYWLL